MNDSIKLSVFSDRFWFDEIAELSPEQLERFGTVNTSTLTREQVLAGVERWCSEHPSSVDFWRYTSGGRAFGVEFKTEGYPAVAYREPGAAHDERVAMRVAERHFDTPPSRGLC